MNFLRFVWGLIWLLWSMEAWAFTFVSLPLVVTQTDAHLIRLAQYPPSVLFGFIGWHGAYGLWSIVPFVHLLLGATLSIYLSVCGLRIIRNIQITGKGGKKGDS